MMLPNKPGKVRSVYLPFALIIAFVCLMVANLYFLLRYPLRIHQIITLEQQIALCRQTITNQEKELKRINPAITSTQELGELINLHNKIALEFEGKYSELKTKTTSRTKVSRGGSYRPFQLPQYKLSSADSEMTKLNVLNSNLEFIGEELDKTNKQLQDLYTRYAAYDRELDYTPTIYPLVTKGYITSYFGYRRDPVTGRLGVYHEGLDIAARKGTPVRATADGTVTMARSYGTYGLFVEIQHGSYGYKTRYAHNSKILVKVGQKVKKGDIIAYVGSTGKSTGPHLHYEVLVNGKPVNPQNYLP
ncbi:MAG TPA: peptidoglycan DD-metalloendopeptidase family protein [Firmicutes bacterium]|jgi:murein DD-endopeptidase MepM/ murein hydrolase activator NlpD|nr:peptidoglycan DD-metalloendopeptidase family protein [Bacillota bacterium]